MPMRIVQVADVRAGDHGRDGDHDRAERTHVVGPEGQLGLVDRGPGEVRCGGRWIIVP